MKGNGGEKPMGKMPHYSVASKFLANDGFCFQNFMLIYNAGGENSRVEG